jgi:hypothetical protein
MTALMEPMRQSRPHSSPVRSSRHDRIRVCSGLLAVALASCTLTQDDFEPALAESGLLEPGPDAGSAADGAVPPVEAAPRGACSAATVCPPGFECSGDVCVQSVCAGSEDPAACVPALCAGGSCAAETCTDGLRAADEADVDCGGPCAPCASGAACESGADCASGACSAGRCAEPGCSDGVLNQDESSADCGGAICPRCAVGAACRSDSDCDTGAFCSPAARACAAQSCQNGLRDGGETGVDCGGGCPGCAPGVACAAATDCASGVCSDGACAEPSCSDAARNGDETGVDCGGSCDGCAPGVACSEPADCQSAVCEGAGCAGGLDLCCQAPACEDGVKNGTESAIDCGGGCGGCALGTACAASGDCATNVCDGGVCATLCGDGEADGDEGGIDCGGSESGCPACPRCNEQNSIVLGAVASQTTLAGDACAMITTFPGYPPTLLNSLDDGPYPVPISWRQECSGQAGLAVFTAAFTLLPLTGLSTACPVILDLGGSPQPFSLIWY